MTIYVTQTHITCITTAHKKDQCICSRRNKYMINRKRKKMKRVTMDMRNSLEFVGLFLLREDGMPNISCYVEFYEDILF